MGDRPAQGTLARMLIASVNESGKMPRSSETIRFSREETWKNGAWMQVRRENPDVLQHHWRKDHSKTHWGYYEVDRCEWGGCTSCTPVLVPPQFIAKRPEDWEVGQEFFMTFRPRRNPPYYLSSGNLVRVPGVGVLLFVGQQANKGRLVLVAPGEDGSLPSEAGAFRDAKNLLERKRDRWGGRERTCGTKGA